MPVVNILVTNQGLEDCSSSRCNPSTGEADPEGAIVAVIEAGLRERGFTLADGSRGLSTSWQRGRTTSCRHGARCRKLRDHIFMLTGSRENDLEVKGYELSKTSPSDGYL